jgi:hypothetical protein
VRSLTTKGPRRTAALIVASAAVMLVAAACGGGSDKASGSGGNAGGGTNGGGMNQALTAYVDCMKQNGVTITLPSFPAGRASRGPGGYGNGGARPSGQPRPRPSGSFGGGRGFPGGGGFFQKPAGVDDATWQKAQQACASSLPSRGAGFGGGRDNGANAAYRNCLQQHGVTLTNGRPSTSDPKFQAAEKTCAVLRPSASATPTS